MPKFLSDEDMAKLEQASPSSPKSKKMISDDEMLALEQSEKNKPGYIESGVRGLAQGVSMGFADELTGLLESALSDKTYEQARDESRAAYKAAEQANPKTYMGGHIAGAVAPILASGGTGALGVGARALATTPGLLAAGAAQGLGGSEANLAPVMRGEFQDADFGRAAVDTGIGLGLGGLGVGAGKVASKLAPSAERVAESVLNSKTGQYIKNVAGDIGTSPTIAGKELSMGSYDTLPGKLYHGTEQVETALKKFGNFPERAGAEIQEVAGDVLSNPVAGAFKYAGRKFGQVKDAVNNAKMLADPIGSDIANYAEMNAKPMLNRVVDTGLGVGADLMTTGGMLATPAMTSKVAGYGLGAARKGVRDAAEHTYLSMDNVHTLAPHLGKYGKVLMNAAARGGQSLAATDFVLQQTDPQYREALKNAKVENSDKSEAE